MKDFAQCREEVIEEAFGMNWSHFVANYRLLEGSLIDVYNDRAAVVYARQVATRSLQNAANNAKIKCCGEEMFFKSVCIDSIIDPANIEL